jgi:hypothetical protein
MRDRYNLQRDTSWVKTLNPNAVVCSPNTYGVVLHGIGTKTISMATEGKEQAIQRFLLENPHRFHEETTILYIGWLNRNNMSKKLHTSVVLEFGHPEDANNSIDLGLVWQAQKKNCAYYDRTMRLLQCDCCHKFGHMLK